MKKIISIFVVIMILGLFNHSFSQGLYVGVDAGYALRTGSLGLFNTPDNDTWEIIPYSFGKGFDAGVLVGYRFNKNIGAELGISYLIGGKYKTTFYTGLDDVFENTYKGNMLRLIPSLVISAGFDKIDPYAKFGIIVGVLGSKITERTRNYEDGSSVSNTEYRKLKDYGGVAFGFAGAVGADYNLSDQLAVFAEINLEGLSYAPTKGKYTEWTLNGADQLSGKETYQKEFEYVTKQNNDYNPSDTPGSPRKEIRGKEPFSSIGLNVGVKIKL